ncbi:SET domain-containing protein 9 [Mortierella polycephala]|uniref:SET domain-containing protein 9 n=1 Tax=Mortierella polycephala TaxID=41804 RepID=A0A9P6PYZ6_9FUNG|nr:SET domain-containing protein 9 [Mortierella polycephala]
MRDFIHRFYPYQALKLMLQRIRPAVRSGKRIGPVSSEPMSPSASNPTHVWPQHQERAPEPFDPVATQVQLVTYFRALKQIASQEQDHDRLRQSVTQQQLGFHLEISPSKIPNAGLGVFLKRHTHRNEKSLPAGSIVAMYPGTLYRPGEAIFFNSIHNRYILKCQDGVYVDGKAKGLSGWIFRSVNGRDNYPGITPTADTTWMLDWSAFFTTAAAQRAGAKTCDSIGTACLKNPLAVGQIINNGTRLFPPNVRYQELDLRTRECPLELQEFLPNIWYSGDWHAHDQVTEDEDKVDWDQRSQSDLDHLRTVVLVTTRTIEQDEELYSTYIE